jgi:hypothetical protein
MDSSRLRQETSFLFLCVASVGAGLALALATLVADAGITMAILVFAGTAAFGLAADGRAERVRKGPARTR